VNDTAQTVGIAAIAFGLMRLLEKVITGLMDKKPQNGNGGSSGSKSAEFWKLEIRGIVEKAIDERVVPVMNQIRESLSILIRWKGGD
jgi:hypothetical protein